LTRQGGSYDKDYMSVWENSHFTVYGKSPTNVYALRFQIEF